MKTTTLFFLLAICMTLLIPQTVAAGDWGISLNLVPEIRIGYQPARVPVYVWRQVPTYDVYGTFAGYVSRRVVVRYEYPVRYDYYQRTIRFRYGDHGRYDRHHYDRRRYEDRKKHGSKDKRRH